MSTFKFRCVFCRQKIEAEESWIGMFAECPSCGRRIEVRREDEYAVIAPLSPEPEPEQFSAPRTAEPPRTGMPEPFPKPCRSGSFPAGKSRGNEAPAHLLRRFSSAGSRGFLCRMVFSGGFRFS